MTTRRTFLSILASIPGFAALLPAIPALKKGRAPYMSVGDGVSYIGHCPGGFGGTQVVESVGPWDGTGYPVQTWNNAYGSHRALDTYYDFDLSDFRKDVPAGFWHSQRNRSRYPNVHTYVREQRFGEHVTQAMKHLNFQGVQLPKVSLHTA